MVPQWSDGIEGALSLQNQNNISLPPFSIQPSCPALSHIPYGLLELR